jgi:putative spermidine/putrescine transport system substrate-binding protein
VQQLGFELCARSGGAAASSGASAAAGGGKAATATSAADMGGVDADVRRRARPEGQVTLHRDTARLGELRPDDQRLHREVRDQGPVRQAGRGQPGRDHQAQQLAGTGRQPDLFDLGSSSPRRTPTCTRPYKVATWADIPDANKEATGLWCQQLHGFESIGYDTKLGDIPEGRDLADPKYKGKVALNGTRSRRPPAQRRRDGRARQRRLGRQHRPRRRLLQEALDSGNLIPVDPAPATIASARRRFVIDWTYNNGAQTAVLQPKGITWKTVIPSDAPPVAAFYNSAINKDAAHPAAARCWMEYIFSDAGQNTYLKGFALPVRLAAMQEGQRARRHCACGLNPPTTAPVVLTQEQTDAATKYLTDNWKFITIK